MNIETKRSLIHYYKDVMANARKKNHIEYAIYMIGYLKGELPTPKIDTWGRLIVPKKVA